MKKSLYFYTEGQIIIATEKRLRIALKNYRTNIKNGLLFAVRNYIYSGQCDDFELLFLSKDEAENNPKICHY